MHVSAFTNKYSDQDSHGSTQLRNLPKPFTLALVTEISTTFVILLK